MSAATSPSTQRPYGVQRVCRIWARLFLGFGVVDVWA
jgi:hypothetical protein